MGISVDDRQWLIRVGRWLDEFEKISGDWGDWMNETYRIFMLGQFGRMDDGQSKGREAAQAMVTSLEMRRRLMEEARQKSHVFQSLREVVMAMAGGDGRMLSDRLLKVSIRMQALRQQSISLWVLVCQSQHYTEDFLRILSTGDAQSATYHPSEGDHGGGRLVDQAA